MVVGKVPTLYSDFGPLRGRIERLLLHVRSGTSHDTPGPSRPSWEGGTRRFPCRLPTRLARQCMVARAGGTRTTSSAAWDPRLHREGRSTVSRSNTTPQRRPPKLQGTRRNSRTRPTIPRRPLPQIPPGEGVSVPSPGAPRRQRRMRGATTPAHSKDTIATSVPVVQKCARDSAGS
jgi:hypothetical protein